MIAALSLYDWPEIRDETDAFWSALARRLSARGVDAPAALDRDYRYVLGGRGLGRMLEKA